MKKAYIINLKYGIWENQLWLEADDNEVMQEKWEIAKAKLTDVAGDRAFLTVRLFKNTEVSHR
mgnify:CR=1 FL=1